MSKKTTTKSTGKFTSIQGGKGTGASGSSTTTSSSGPGSGKRGGGGSGKGGGPTGRDFDSIGNTIQGAAPNGNVVDFTSARAQRNLDNRRVFERFFMQHMVDVYCEINGREMIPVEMVEISESGCSFRVPADKTEVLPRDTTGAIQPLNIRLYFSKDSYLRIGMSVVNSTRDIAHKGQAMRYGCRIDESYASTDAYRQFARFMAQFVAHAARDTKNVSSY
jgi:hypothetical protein